VANPTDKPVPVHAIDPVPEPVGSENAPFIYFDAAPAFGVSAGAVQIELAAFTIIPIFGDGSNRVEPVITAHLRCSSEAARDLHRALNSVLLMLEKPEGLAN
jgi:hypothetical protein